MILKHLSSRLLPCQCRQYWLSNLNRKAEMPMLPLIRYRGQMNRPNRYTRYNFCLLRHRHLCLLCWLGGTHLFRLTRLVFQHNSRCMETAPATSCQRSTFYLLSLDNISTASEYCHRHQLRLYSSLDSEKAMHNNDRTCRQCLHLRLQ